MVPPAARYKQMKTHNQPGFLQWIARIILTGYYNERDSDDTYDEDEVVALTEITELWLTNDKPDATEREVIDFMFDNRRT